MAGISGNSSKRIKMETPPSTTSLILIKDEELHINFQRELPRALNSTAKQGGNNGITAGSGKEASYFEVMSTDELTAQVNGDDNFDMYLRCMLRKTLGNRSEWTSDYMELSWKLAFVSDTFVTLTVVVGGDFFEGFLRNLGEPNRDRRANDCGLEDELKVSTPEFKEPIQTNVTYTGKVTIGMLVIRQMVFPNLSCVTAIGREILENGLQSDFEIIAEDDSRFKCNKVFLAGCSKALAGMLEMDCKETREKAMKLGMSGKGLMEVGNQYDILGLEKAMRRLFLGQKYDWFDIDSAVLLYNWTLRVDGNKDLKWKAIQVF
ncbi:hypothetical protein Ocin01_17814 [Orchesella cincta]|uniref:BTB domain-containing protein n=1 Tax=Orchesella cincta TaxID=48709 RepID=A0A1D2M7C7_ORCCI|nr:hypothetical protein Ocin01_17814 [Orchesella cincta]